MKHSRGMLLWCKGVFLLLFCKLKKLTSLHAQQNIGSRRRGTSGTRAATSRFHLFIVHTDIFVYLFLFCVYISVLLLRFYFIYIYIYTLSYIYSVIINIHARSRVHRLHRESIAASLYDINHWNRGKDLIVPKAIGFLTNNFISSKYRREKVEKRLSSGYPGWSKKEGRGEKLFQFSFKRVCTSILCALTVVQYIFIPDIIAIITLQEKKKKRNRW